MSGADSATISHVEDLRPSCKRIMLDVREFERAKGFSGESAERRPFCTPQLKRLLRQSTRRAEHSHARKRAGKRGKQVPNFQHRHVSKSVR